MAASQTKQWWKKDYVQTGLLIVVMLVVVLGVWLGVQVVLGTQYPALAVASGSMCLPQHMNCDGFSHPFDHTLHKGDLIIVQAVDPRTINDNYPNSDIIVFYKPKSSPAIADELIVHRVIHKEERNGLLYFKTKGDANNIKWPADPQNQVDSWSGDYRGENYTLDNMISEKLLIGKVVLRIPWLGHVALFMREASGIYIILALIVLLVIIEFALPVLKGKKPEAKPEGTAEKPCSDLRIYKEYLSIH